MKAIILAAGKGTRLGEIGESIPKCLIRIGNKTIIEHQIEALNSNDIKDISVVLGYQDSKVREILRNKNIKFYLNKDYETTGMLESFFCAKNELNDDVMLIYGDVIFTANLIKKISENKDDFCLVIDSKKEVKGDTQVRIVDNVIKEISKNIPLEESSGKYIGIAKFSKEAIKIVYNRIKLLIDNGEIKKYPSPSFLFRWLIDNRKHINVEYTDNSLYEEIDDLEDLKRAKYKFESL